MNSLNYCRFCLESELYYLTDIFDEKFNIPDKISETLSMQVTTNDRLSNKICEFCIWSMSYIQKYKSVVKKAEEQFNLYLKSTKGIEKPRQERMQSKIKYSMQSQFNQLEEHLNRNLDRFSRNLQQQGVAVVSNSVACSNDVIMENCGETERFSESTALMKKSTAKNVKSLDVDSKRNIDVNIHKSQDLAESNNKIQKKIRPKSKAIVICELCGVELLEYLLESHMNKHNGIYPFKCEVEGCESAFTHPGPLKAHEGVHNSRNYVCALCGGTFKQKKAIQVHMEFHIGPTIPCKICGKLMINRTLLNKHMMAHTGERPYKCHNCKKTWVSLSSLKIHMNVHIGARNYVCVHCGMSYAHNCSLRAHLEKIHPNEITKFKTFKRTFFKM